MNRHRIWLACSLMALLATPLLATWDDGVSAFRAGRYGDAVTVFQSYVASNSNAPEGHYMLGLSLLRQKKLAAAIGPLSDALSLSEDDARYRMTLAQALLKAGKAGEALDVVAAQDPAAVTDSARAGFHQLLAKAASSSGRDADAYASLEKALAVDPGARVLWLARANLANRLERPEDAFEALSTAFELDPSDPEPARSAVQTALAAAQSEADADARRQWYVQGTSVAARLAPAFPTPENLRLAGGASMGAGDYEGATAFFEQTLATGDQDPMLHYDLGRCRQALGQDETALGHLDAALERSPDAALVTSIHAGRARALRGLEEFTDAAAAYRLAGDADSAAEMEHYAQNRLEWAEAKADCVKKRSGLENLLAETADIKHTREYKQAEQDLAAIVTACEPFFSEG